MPLLVRKINKAKWMQNDILSGEDVSADAITTCMKTFQNALSTWRVSREEEVEDAVLAMVAGQERLETMDVVFIDRSSLEDKGINLKSTPGITPLKELINKHIDICDLTYRLLGVVAENIVRSIKDEKIKRYTKKDLKKILTEAIEAGRLHKNDLNEYLQSKL
jgi:hypothetical protein